jgi:hypothetical protein
MPKRSFRESWTWTDASKSIRYKRGTKYEVSEACAAYADYYDLTAESAPETETPKRTRKRAAK